MKKKIKGEIMMAFFIIMSFLFGFSFSQLINDSKNSLSNVESLNCSSNDLFDVSYCLKNNLSSWFKYNISNKGKELTFEQLKTEGGVCSHSADWYYNQINKSLFYAEKVSMNINKSLSHKFAIISNNKGYCVLDQLNIGCVRFANE